MGGAILLITESYSGLSKTKLEVCKEFFFCIAEKEMESAEVCARCGVFLLGPVWVAVGIICCWDYLQTGLGES